MRRDPDMFAASDASSRRATHRITATPLIIATYCRRSVRPGQSAAGIVIKPSRLTGSIPVIATLLVAGLGLAAPTSTARAKDCLAAPNSPAPEGTWWYYRLEWPTQRKCWYLRSLGKPAQQTIEGLQQARPARFVHDRLYPIQYEQLIELRNQQPMKIRLHLRRTPKSHRSARLSEKYPPRK